MKTIKANIQVSTTGRSAAIMNRYRPSFSLNGRDGNSDCEVRFSGEITPGSSADVEIVVIHPDLIKGEINVHSRFELKEGNRVTANGIVL